MKPTLQGKEIVKNGDFSVVLAADGKVAALWANHGAEFASMEELLKASVLNCHEKSILLAWSLPKE